MRRDSHGSLNPACRALLAVVAALAVVPAAGGTLPCPESRPMLPLLAGTRWVYRGMVVSTVGGEYSDAHVVRGVRTRTMDVRTVEYEAGTTVALVEGFPAELNWYEDERPREKYVVVAREHRGFRLVDDGDECEFDRWRESCLGPLSPEKTSFMLPGILRVGRTFGGERSARHRPDKWYRWHVEEARCVQLRGVSGIDPARQWREYRIGYRTNPAHVLVYFVPGLGITRYVYRHHGTPASTDVRLIEFGRSRVSAGRVGVARRAPR